MSVDPFGDMGKAAQTHEHFDHNAVEVVGGSPAVIRSTAGRWSRGRRSSPQARRTSSSSSPTAAAGFVDTAARQLWDGGYAIVSGRKQPAA